MAALLYINVSICIFTSMESNHKKIDFYGTEMMTWVSGFKVALFTLVLVLRPITEGQFVPVVPVAPFAPRPLCNYQMALANQACAYLPYIQVPPAAPRAQYTPPPPSSDEDDTPEPEHRHRRNHRHEDDEDHDHDHDEDPDHDHDDRDHDDHDHDDDGHDNDNEHNHGHKNHHRHHHKHHHHHHRNTPVEQQCCKWLSQVDDQCVCELLVRLPPFLARPLHRYSVIVGRACNITYACGSRLRK